MSNNYGTYVDCSTHKEVHGLFISDKQLEAQRKYAAMAKAKAHDTEAGRNYTSMSRDTRADSREKTMAGALLVLSTYAQFDRGDGLCALGYSEANLFKTVKYDFTKVLGVSLDVAYKIEKELIDNEYLYKIEDTFYLNPTVAYRGATDSKNYMKVYHMFTRQLVEYGAKLEHIGALYLMLPYISYKDNCLYLDQLNATGIMTKSSLAATIGVGRPFIDKLMKMTVWYTPKGAKKAKEVAVFGIFTTVNTDPETRAKKKMVKKIVVNPLILHGDDMEVTGILSMFLNNK